MMERYMNSNSTTVAILLLLFLVVLVFSAIMFFAENYGIFMVLFGLFMIYKYMFFNGPSLSLLFKDIAGFGLGVLSFIIGGLFIFANGITFQSFINLF
jgi:hypothetical protein